MKIELQQCGKRYRREWILRRIDYTFAAGGRYAITGPNGSGKSTLLKLLSGHLSPSKGKVSFSYEGQLLPVESVYPHLAFAAPYIELIEEFTLRESLEFHQKFRPLLAGLNTDSLIDLLGLQSATHLPVHNFSSGMKQRLKLALACCSQADYILLDEPTTNLDDKGAEWYQQLLTEFVGDRLLVVASNVASDYRFCQETFSILDYK
jgi:ABC-type multidrug transport system ATPase subunit